MVGRLKQDRWTGPEGQTRSKIQIVAEHMEFKPQAKKDGKGGGAAEDEGKAREKAAEEKAQDEVEPKKAASF